MSIDLTQLLAQHYSTVRGGLVLDDSDTIKWEHDGYGHLKAHVVQKVEVPEVKE